MTRSAGVRAAFTLIEVTAVLVLTAVLAAAAVVMLNGPRDRAAATEAVEQVGFADAQVRQSAVNGDAAGSLIIDLAHGRLSRATGAVLADLPRGVRITRVLLGDGDTVDAGTATIAVSAGGRSASYALGMSTPAGPRWVVVAGLTGRPTAVVDEAAADAALAPVRAVGP